MHGLLCKYSVLTVTANEDGVEGLWNGKEGRVETKDEGIQREQDRELVLIIASYGNNQLECFYARNVIVVDRDKELTSKRPGERDVSKRERDRERD